MSGGKRHCSSPAIPRTVVRPERRGLLGVDRRPRFVRSLRSFGDVNESTVDLHATK